MNRDFLSGLLKDVAGADELINRIMDENGRDIEKSKESANTLKKEIEGLKTQLSEANKQIEGFKTMDIESIKKAADDYKAKFEQAEQQGREEIEKLKFDYAVQNALTGAKVKNAKAVMALLDMNALKLNGSEVVGLGEQLEKIKAENDYLFESSEPQVQLVRPSSGTKTDLSGVEAAFLRKNPNLKLE